MAVDVGEAVVDVEARLSLHLQKLLMPILISTIQMQCRPTKNSSGFCSVMGLVACLLA